MIMIMIDGEVARWRRWRWREERRGKRKRESRWRENGSKNKKEERRGRIGIVGARLCMSWQANRLGRDYLPADRHPVMPSLAPLAVFSASEAMLAHAVLLDLHVRFPLFPPPIGIDCWSRTALSL